MNTEKLIGLVRNYSFLYDQEDKYYCDHNKKGAAWKKIGEILNQPAKECKRQWNSLRDSFRRSLKKRRDAESGQTAYRVKKWKYDDEMSFLISCIKDRETTTSTTIQDESNDKNYETNAIEDDRSSITNTPSPKASDQTDSIAVSRTTGRKIIDTPNTTSAALTDFVLSNATATQEPATDDTDLFFKSIALSVKKLTPYNQVIAKARVLSILSEIQIQELSQNNNPNISSQLSVVSTPSPSQYIYNNNATNNSQPSTSCADQNIVQIFNK